MSIETELARSAIGGAANYVKAKPDRYSGLTLAVIAVARAVLAVAEAIDPDSGHRADPDLVAYVKARAQP